MSEACNGQCSGCSSGCSEQKVEDMHEPTHELSNIKKVIGVVSGKGGVGKSLVTSLLAVLTRRNQLNTAILDADITGPSIPRAFGLTEKATGDEIGMFPVTSKMGTRIMSVNLLLQNDNDPVVWRGPVIAGAVKQFWTDTIWGDVDYMFVDMPPGTGDVPLTVFQSIPLDGIIIVTSPQELVTMVVEKAVKMAGMMNIPVLSLVENMSYIKCPDCGKEISPFGESRLEKTAKQFGISVTDRMPIEPELASQCDKGLIELFEPELLTNTMERLLQL